MPDINSDVYSDPNGARRPRLMNQPPAGDSKRLNDYNISNYQRRSINVIDQTCYLPMRLRVDCPG